MKRLSVEDEAGNVRVVTLPTGEFSIGRAPDNDLVLPERNVSRHHARIRCEGDRCVLQDAGSRYGIRLAQGKVAGETEIRPGQVFQLGDFRIKVLSDDDALAEEPEPDEAVTPLATPVVSRETEALPTLQEPASGDSLRKIRELEEFAQQGWASDFDAEDPAEKRQAGRYLLALLVLVLVALGLGWAYYQLSEEEAVLAPPPTTSSPPRPEPAAPVETQKPPAQEIRSAPAEASQADRVGQPENQGDREGRGATNPAPATSRRSPAAPAAGRGPAGTAHTTQRPSPGTAAPETAQGSTTAPSDESNAYKRAKARLQQCVKTGDHECANAAYREARNLTTDPREREALDVLIGTLRDRTE